MKLSRRDLLKKAGFFSGYTVLSAASAPFLSQFAAAQPGLFTFPRVEPQFPQGVGSADPQPNAVLVWTRAIPAGLRYGPDQPVVLQVSQDETFASVLLERSLTAQAENDYTLRVVVKDLHPDTTYYYRFLIDGNTSSRIGRTWTAPPRDASRPAHIMLASCQSFPIKKYGAYRNFLLSQERGDMPRVDFILHVGDYIYEGTPDESEPLIAHESGNEEFDNRIAHYRRVYRGYLQDPDLQEARALYPFVVVWDDHEFTNDGWQSGNVRGAPNQPRRLAATRAFFEFVPQILDESLSIEGMENMAHDYREPGQPVNRTRRFDQVDDNFLFTDPDNLAALNAMTIYRTISWGSLVDLIIPDLRSYRSPGANPGMSLAALIEGTASAAAFEGASLYEGSMLRTLAEGREANGGNPPETVTNHGVTVANPRRNDPPVTMLGAEQKNWYKQCLTHSKARWKVIANAVPMAGFYLNPGDVVPEAGNGYKWTDSWDGFPNEREELMNFIKQQGLSNVVSLSGDRHAHYAGLVVPDYETDATDYVIPEFTCTAISAFARAGDFRNSFEAYGAGYLGQYEVPHWDGTPRRVANGNIMMRMGAKAADVMYRTGDLEQAREAADPTVNPHLRYADNDAHGYVVAHFFDDRVDVDFVAVPQQDWGPDIYPEGPPTRRRVGFRTEAWDAGEKPEIVQTYAEGEPNWGDA